MDLRRICKGSLKNGGGLERRPKLCWCCCRSGKGEKYLDEVLRDLNSELTLSQLRCEHS
jgi:hypothetical protein